MSTNTDPCSVCYEEITVATGCVKMSCSHYFHYRCITKWFDSQEANDKPQSCPCCRSEPPEIGRLPVAEAEGADDAETLEYEQEYQRQEREAQAAVAAAAPDPWAGIPDSAIMEMLDRMEAPRNRAKARFDTLRQVLTEEQLNNYSASRIIALFKGAQVRTDMRVSKMIRGDIKESFENLCEAITVKNEARRQLHIDRIIARIHEQCLPMGRKEWKNWLATKIQCWWRILSERRRAAAAAEAQKQASVAPSEVLNVGLKILVTWKRTDGHIWERVVYNPEERDPEVFNQALHALPPQSLEFEMSRAVIKMQAVWRGHSARMQYRV